MVGSIYSEAQEFRPDPKTLQKYHEERNKRYREDGMAQFLDLDKTERFKYLEEDPFVDHDALNAQQPVLKDGEQCQFLIYGAGYGGIIFAVRLIEAGFRAEDIMLVDTAGGYGGTWYWNRYPGLMCDVESYCYMPLLEETGYMPKHKYSYQPELREQADRIADQWHLQALFRTKVDTQTWDESRKQWRLDLTENRGPSQGTRKLQVHANFVIMTGGLIPVPHIPKLEGLEEFRGEHFHTARWNWKATGGSEHDQQLTELKGKTVGIIGTGATAVQLVPELAKWAKDLYVFQRTPSSCDVRGQRATTASDWAAITAQGPGWQSTRMENFNKHVRQEAPAGSVNLVNDGWTAMPGYLTVLGQGGPPLTADQVPAHVARMNALDLPRAERVRARVDGVVADRATAASLKAWYASWCKRPCFHDAYLPAFNAPNVHLVDTDGRGVERLTPAAVVANATEFPVDVLIFGTGYRPPMPGSPALNANVKVVGRDGVDMDEKWERVGAATLHGVAANGFPNCFVWSPSQTGLAPNAVAVIDLTARHAAYIASEARRRAGGGDVPFAVQPTREAEEAWSTESAMRAAWFSPLMGCTPGYLNKEGMMDKMAEMSPEEQFKQGRAAHWGGGWVDYREKVEKWEREGNMEGMEVWT